MAEEVIETRMPHLRYSDSTSELTCESKKPCLNKRRINHSKYCQGVQPLSIITEQNQLNIKFLFGKSRTLHQLLLLFSMLISHNCCLINEVTFFTELPLLCLIQQLRLRTTK